MEKEMATHSSVLAWRIPGMGEPGGLPSVGHPRHDPVPDPRRPASPRPGRAPGALPTFTTAPGEPRPHARFQESLWDLAPAAR